MRASISRERQLGARDQPDHPDERGGAVERRRELRDDEPAAAVAGEDHLPRRRQLAVSASGDVEVQMTSTPWKRQTCSATRVVVTGSAT